MVYNGDIKSCTERESSDGFGMPVPNVRLCLLRHCHGKETKRKKERIERIAVEEKGILVTHVPIPSKDSSRFCSGCALSLSLSLTYTRTYENKML